ncbi:MAG TPA: CAP domain-containing protein [Acidimicrobiales bacterium]|nr:CAP domain-containing protein [Acidimicrobiales bacterium]
MTPLISLLAQTPAAASTTDTADAAAFVAAINQLRGSQHLAPLAVNQQLASVALGWSQTMATTGAISHNPSLPAAMPVGWQKGGENVGMGATEPLIQNAFVNSPEHYANMVDPAFNQIGVGVVMISDGMLYVTEDFMEAPVAAPPAPTPTAQSALKAATAGSAPAVQAASPPAPPPSQAPGAGSVTAPIAAGASPPTTAAPSEAVTPSPVEFPADPRSAPTTTLYITHPRAVTLAAQRSRLAGPDPRATIPTALTATGLGLDLGALLAVAGMVVPLTGRRTRRRVAPRAR